MKTRDLVLCSLMAALTAVCSQIVISLPITVVPINLATLAVAMSALILGSKLSALSMLVYIMMGGFGMPVFAQMSGGFGVLLGPTGGYIIGYVFMALLAGKLMEVGVPKTVSLVFGNAILYVFGTIWFMLSTHNGLLPSLMMCVVPFLIGDGLKIITAITVAQSIKKRVKI